MNIEDVRTYCLTLRNTTECLPFDDVSLVFKVENKMFLLLPLDATEPYVAVKCSREVSEIFFLTKILSVKRVDRSGKEKRLISGWMGFVSEVIMYITMLFQNV